jgi:hypothetical protein
MIQPTAVQVMDEHARLQLVGADLLDHGVISWNLGEF